MTEQEAIKNALNGLKNADIKISNEIRYPSIMALEMVAELEKRNMSIETLKNYMQFEDECVQKDFTFKSLLEARKKQMPKNWLAHYLGEGESIWSCPSCENTICLMDGTPQDNNYNYCPACGQALAEKKGGQKLEEMKGNNNEC